MVDFQKLRLQPARSTADREAEWAATEARRLEEKAGPRNRVFDVDGEAVEIARFGRDRDGDHWLAIYVRPARPLDAMGGAEFLRVMVLEPAFPTIPAAVDEGTLAEGMRIRIRGDLRNSRGTVCLFARSATPLA